MADLAADTSNPAESRRDEERDDAPPSRRRVAPTLVAHAEAGDVVRGMAECGIRGIGRVPLAVLAVAAAYAGPRFDWKTHCRVTFACRGGRPADRVSCAFRRVDPHAPPVDTDAREGAADSVAAGAGVGGAGPGIGAGAECVIDCGPLQAINGLTRAAGQMADGRPWEMLSVNWRVPESNVDMAWLAARFVPWLVGEIRSRWDAEVRPLLAKRPDASPHLPPHPWDRPVAEILAADPAWPAVKHPWWSPARDAGGAQLRMACHPPSRFATATKFRDAVPFPVAHDRWREFIGEWRRGPNGRPMPPRDVAFQCASALAAVGDAHLTPAPRRPEDAAYPLEHSLTLTALVSPRRCSTQTQAGLAAPH